MTNDSSVHTICIWYMTICMLLLIQAFALRATLNGTPSQPGLQCSNKCPDDRIAVELTKHCSY